MTISTQEYALMAGNAYRSNTNDGTRLPIPGGWQQLAGPLGQRPPAEPVA